MLLMKLLSALSNVLIVLFLLLLISSVSCLNKGNSKEDWPQFMGPDRDGTWHLDVKKDTLLPGDLSKIWEINIGSGYSGPTIAKGRVYLMDHYRDNGSFERVSCFDAETGMTLWSFSYECSYNVGYPTGPRASVTIDKDRAYSLGTMGELYCLNAKSGEVIWHIDGQQELNSSIPIWGLAASPLVYGKILILHIGGTPDACIVGLDKYTGEEIWRSVNDDASYSSPIMINRAGRDILVCWTGNFLSGLNPESGEIYWQLPFYRKDNICSISIPVVDWPYIFLNNYDGSLLVELNDEIMDAKIIWEQKGRPEKSTDGTGGEVEIEIGLNSMISAPVIKDNYVYGVDFFGDVRCLDLATGRRIWNDKGIVPDGRFVNAHLIKQGDRTWAFNEKGELILCKFSPEGYKDLGRAKIIDPFRVSPNPRGGVNWAFPAFSGRRIYARSDNKLVCYELKDNSLRTSD